MGTTWNKPCGQKGSSTISPCVAPAMDFMCNSMCSDKCKANSEVKKMFGGPGRRLADEPTCDDGSGQGQSMKSDEMASAFNFMCMKGPSQEKVKKNEGFYCLTKGNQLEKQGAFKEENITAEYPNPCSIDCSTKTSKAVKELGCCMASAMDMMSKSVGNDTKKANELKLMKAVAWKCGGNQAMELCSGGSLLATEILQAKKTIPKCPTTTADESALAVEIAKDLDVSFNTVSLMVCAASGDLSCSSSRRLGERRLASNELHYTVKIVGANASTVAAKKKLIESKPSFKKAEAPKVGKESSGASSLCGGFAAVTSLALLAAQLEL